MSPAATSPSDQPVSPTGSPYNAPAPFELNDPETSKAWPWMICGALLLATMLNYMDRQALAVTLPTLKAQFNLAEARVGMVEGCFGYAFAFGSLLFGWLADRLGPRLLYPAVLTGWSLAGIATAFAGQPWINAILESPGDTEGTGVFRWLLICRVCLGVCEAGHWPCALITVRAILTAKHRTLGNGILQAGASIGAVIVPIYIAAANRAGQPWQFPFWSIGLVGMCWVPLWLILVGKRNLRVPKVEKTGGDEPEAKESPSNTVRRIVAAGIVVASLTISWQFLRVWIVLFLQDHHKFSSDVTAGLTSGYFIASDIGCILSGILVARLAMRGFSVHTSRVIGFAVFTVLTACGAMVPFAGDGRLMVTLLYVAGAGILGLHPFYYSMTQELSVRHMGAISGSLAAFGWIVSSTSQIYIGQRIQATHSYQQGLLMVGLAPVIGLIALVLIWPRSSVSTKS